MGAEAEDLARVEPQANSGVRGDLLGVGGQGLRRPRAGLQRAGRPRLGDAGSPAAAGGVVQVVAERGIRGGFSQSAMR